MTLNQVFRMSFFFIFCIFLFGCAGDESNVGAENLTEDTSDLDENSIISQGLMTGQNGYSTRGEISLFYDESQDLYTLVLDNFTSDDGPALFVYLSEGPNPNNFTNLGALKALNGTIRYEFSGDRFEPEFDHVLVWCERVSRSFGAAEIE